MDPTLEDTYLIWLYELVTDRFPHSPVREYWSFARQLQTKPFEVVVLNDENRVADAYDLRILFLNESEITLTDPAWLDLECSMLELMVILARRGDFETDEGVTAWFWRMVENAQLVVQPDNLYSEEVFETNDKILDTIINRTYSPDGWGSFFPVEGTDLDQRRLELWYQMSSWIAHNFVF